MRSSICVISYNVSHYVIKCANVMFRIQQDMCDLSVQYEFVISVFPVWNLFTGVFVNVDVKCMSSALFPVFCAVHSSVHHMHFSYLIVRYMAPIYPHISF